MKGICTERCSD